MASSASRGKKDCRLGGNCRVVNLCTASLAGFLNEISLSSAEKDVQEEVLQSLMYAETKFMIHVSDIYMELRFLVLHRKFRRSDLSPRNLPFKIDEKMLFISC